MERPRTLRFVAGALGMTAVVSTGAWADEPAGASSMPVAASVMAAMQVMNATNGAAWETVSTSRTTDLLMNPSSFIRVRTSAEVVAVTEDARPAGRLIAVPFNARAGDPAYAEPEEWAEHYVDGDEQYVANESYQRTYGMVFADGVDLGYTTLRRHDRPDRRVRPPHDIGAAYENEDVHRRAQLRFADAAQPRLDGLDDGFRRAQLTFNRASMPSSGERGADGLRRERAPSSDRPRRTRW